MSLVHKIPPLISALAFGYGVGMSAPESTLKPVRVAAAVYQTGAASMGAIPWEPKQATPYGGMRGDTAALASPAPVGGHESRELARLRDTSDRDPKRGASCELDRPMISRMPRESLMGREGGEVDDLDSAGTAALSKLQLPDMRVSITRRTLKFVRFFTRTDRGRGLFETWLKRSGKYQDMIQSELRERRLPEDLIWVAMIESGFDARVKSPAGAVGLWQFMPSTGGVYGLVQNPWLDQRKNPHLATQAAAHHLRDLYMRFGTWDLALAAYNMGYEQLLDAIDRTGTADFNELARQQAIPEETASYVPKIMAAAIVANNLERFGFERVDVMRPVSSAEIAVPPGTQLKTIAKAAGITSSELRSLNPDFLSSRVPPGHHDHVVFIPADTVSHARAALPIMLKTEPLATDDVHVLDPVDLLGGRELTKRHERGGSDDDSSLLSLLPSYRKHRRTLREPLGEADAEALLRGDLRDEPERPAHRRDARETVVYRVGPGDTLLGIARQFAVDVDDVTRPNHLGDDDKLKVGALLKLRVRRDVVEAAKKDAKDDAPAKPSKHRKHRDG